MPTLRHAVTLQLSEADGRSFGPKYDQRETLTAADPDTDLFNWTVTQAAEVDLALLTVTSADAVVLLTNLDATNFVTYGKKVGGVMDGFLTLQPGETHKIRLASGVTLRAIADTADVLVQVAAIDA